LECFNFDSTQKRGAFGKRKWRTCVDFRRLNDITVSDSFSHQTFKIYWIN